MVARWLRAITRRPASRNWSGAREPETVLIAVPLDAELTIDPDRWRAVRGIAFEAVRTDARRHAIDVLTADPLFRRLGVEVTWWS